MPSCRARAAASVFTAIGSYGLVAVTLAAAAMAWTPARVSHSNAGSHGVAVPASEGPVQLHNGYGQWPLNFVINRGQTDDAVKFMAGGDGYGVFLTSTEAVLSLRAAEPTSQDQSATVVRMRLVDANPQPAISGVDRLAGTSNYFIGSDPQRWQTDVPSYGRVKYHDVYPGIDQVFYGNQRQLEYDLVVAPGADVRRIAVAFDGIRRLAIASGGALVLTTADGDLTQHAPVIYQIVDGIRRTVPGRYVLGADDRVGFDVGGYDPTQPLIIDPVLSYATYLGGNGNDVGHAIAVDGTGSAYIVGETLSTNFPGVNAGSFQAAKAAGYDVFVAKINAAGSGFIYSTYLGGSGGDYGYAIAVDAAGNAYVTGQTDSPTAAGPGNVPFPRAGAVQPLYKGGGDAFVSKINATGNALVYSTYLGGSGVERGYGIAVDGAGNAYITGHTNSVNGPGDFPTAAAFQIQNGGSYDAFVTKLNSAGSGLVYSTYLGGNGSEYSIDGGAIAVDSGGNAYVGGTTASGNFPGASGSAIQATNGGGFNDGFVVKFAPGGGALLYSTYLGGSAYDAVNGLAIASSGDAYVVGYSDSPNFPTAAPLQAARNGTGNDAFVSRINASGTALVYSTYLGGSGGELAYSVAVDASGNAHVSGWTDSLNFPTVDPLQAIRRGAGDAFVAELNPGGSALVHSTYLGGSTGNEHGYGIALDTAGAAYVTGKTSSTNFPVANPFQATFGGSNDDAFLARIVPSVPIVQAPTNLIVNALSGSIVTITWRAPLSGLTPTGYVLEGGVGPGEVLASLPTNSTATTYTFSAPTGAFYIRMHSLAPGTRSIASNEVRLFINVPAPPSAPANLLGTVNGSSVLLAWTNTAGGGAPTDLIVDVTGSLALSLGLAVSETFSVQSVAAGTYTISLRAANALGTSASSNSVTLTVPGPCSGVPEVLTNFGVSKNGNVISASWGLPAGGPAPQSYIVNVSGGFTGTLAVSGTSISGAVGAGTYTVSVSGANACGTGAPTAPLTITIP